MYLQFLFSKQTLVYICNGVAKILQLSKALKSKKTFRKKIPIPKNKEELLTAIVTHYKKTYC
ncbi:hypothetical protein Q764_04585 [Flavobacterium suncheonense GH29-5 = DSM 17707]|uniref:Uncharacterized protein n=1 Tax=Flavobacterium suncheonense GH29-5 = DSM 17707 TaxID=1121899 RepID=A0A0A2ME44_9FLAO|nr:hypothetical protein Q764_04585 [Flavobacterium suncheonense GH29-5 = DSM 17707]